MRRVFMFAAFLLLLGLTTATAASFDVQAEDITSFSQEVTVTVPIDPIVLYLRGGGSIVPGSLSSDPPPNGRVNGKSIIADPAPVDASQSNMDAYHAWESASADTAWTVGGSGAVYVDQKGGTLTAALFECSSTFAAADGAIADADVTGRSCLKIAGPAGSGQSPGGYTEVAITFSVPLTTIEAGHTLRLKVVNQAAANSPVTDLQWGFNPARSSQIALNG